MKYFLILMLFATCQTKTSMQQEKVITYALRLNPGEDLKQKLAAFVAEKQIQAGWIVTCVGSLTQYHLRFANQSEGTQGKGHFEIVSLTGTLSVNGSHLHMSVSDSTGRTIGGHLLEGNLVYTTAEIVIGASNELLFTREYDGTTEWKELQIKKREKPE
jgi:predicted DNA-binding protein with PD1-like motif